jgi:hypothetical protein
MYPEVSFPLKTPAPLYICTSIKQYNHLTFGGTPLSNKQEHPHQQQGHLDARATCAVAQGPHSPRVPNLSSPLVLILG